MTHNMFHHSPGRLFRMSFTALAVAAALAATPAAAQPAASPAMSALPPFPAQLKAPQSAPNVLLVLTDDVGFAATSAFGGTIPTPHFDRLAQRGLRYNAFHTAAICSATRAALLTGRNPTRVGMGGVTNFATSHPGHTTVLPDSAATVADILKSHGYNTAMFGKSHLVPKWESGPTGPFDRWPTGLGFEHFYGFLDGDTDQFAPQLYDGISPVEPPVNDPNYILDKDLADRAVLWLATRHAAQPGKPFFMYFATGTAHSPLQAPREWIDQFKGRFDMGWEALREETLARQIMQGVVPAGTRLSAHPPEIAHWASLDDDQKRLASRTMEIYAATVAYADHQFGRILDELVRQGQLDNTLIVFIAGDNGSSAEGGEHGLFNEGSALNSLSGEDYKVALAQLEQLGGPMAYAHFPAGWAHAMSTPFPYFKRVASHMGATRNGMVLSWPQRTDAARGQVRSQFHNVTDVFPTILEAAGIAAPPTVAGVPQMSIDGVSMLYTLDSPPQAPSRRTTQFFEIHADAAIYADGWLANTRPESMPWNFLPTKATPFAERQWELYHLPTDFSQSTNVAASHPTRLEELKRLFNDEAARNNALPISRSPGGAASPEVTKGRTRFSYVGGIKRLSSYVAPDVRNRSFTIDADVVVPTGGAEGVILTHGGRFGGYGLYLVGGKPVFVYNKLGLARTAVTLDQPLPPGPHTIRVNFRYDGGGMGKGGELSLSVASNTRTGRIEGTIPFLFPLSETFDVGEDTGTPISEDYKVPFKFSGSIRDVTVNLSRSGGVMPER